MCAEREDLNLTVARETVRAFGKPAPVVFYPPPVPGTVWAYWPRIATVQGLPACRIWNSPSTTRTNAYKGFQAGVADQALPTT